MCPQVPGDITLLSTWFNFGNFYNIININAVETAHSDHGEPGTNVITVSGFHCT